MKTVVLRTFDNYFTANIILTRLQDSGIECYLFDENTVTIGPILSNAIGYIKLVINQVDEAEARKMLAVFDEAYMRSAQCPKCLAHEILLVPKPGSKNFITTILTWLFSNYAVSVENVYKCQQCGYESKTLPERPEEFN